MTFYHVTGVLVSFTSWEYSIYSKDICNICIYISEFQLQHQGIKR